MLVEDQQAIQQQAAQAQSLKMAAEQATAQTAVAAGGSGRAPSASAPPPKAGRPPAEGLKLAHQDVIAWMYRSHGATADQAFQFLEAQFGMQREDIAYVLVAVWSLYMMCGGGAQFVSNLIGFVYPCYASVLAIRTPGQEDDTQWLVYWTTFSSFFLVDAFAGVFLSWFPFYFILKSAFLVYLWLPQTNGAQYLYVKYVDPAYSYLEKEFIGKYC